MTVLRDNFRKLVSRKFDDRYMVWAFLVFGISLSLYMNYCYIMWDASQIFCDGQFQYCWYFYNELTEWKFRIIPTLQYPPLVYLVSSIFFRILGFSILTARLSISVFTVVFLLSMYGIGRELGGRLGGVCSFAMAMGSPTAGWAQSQFYLDFPQTAMTALAFFFLLSSVGFKNRNKSILFGFAMGLALLTKWSALFFMAFPIFWFILPHFFRGRRALAVTLTVIIYLVVVGFFILAHLMQLRDTAGWTFFPVKDIFADRQLIDHNRGWQSAYTMGVFLPSLLLFLSSFLMEKRWKKTEEEDSHPFLMLNFARALSVAVAMFGFWLIFNAQGVACKLNVDIFRNSDFDGITVLNYSNLFYHYSFSIPLMIVGSIFAVALSGDRYRRMSLPLSLLFLCIYFRFMLRYYPESLRYVLGVVVFAIPLGGYWIGRAGFLRRPIAILLIAVSLFSLMGWTGASMRSDYYFDILNDTIVFNINSPADWRVACRILRRNPPDPDVYDFNPALRRMEPGRKDRPGMVYVMMGWDNTRQDLIFHPDSFFDESLRMKKYHSYDVYYRPVFLRMVKSTLERPDRYSPDVMLITLRDEYPGDIIEELKKIYPGHRVEIESWDRPRNSRLYFLKFRKI